MRDALTRHGRLAVLLGLCLVVLAPGSSAGAEKQVPAQYTSQVGVNDRRLQECIAERRSLAALFLVDESRSLSTQDRNAARVPALESALSALDLLRSAQSERRLEVFVDFLSFDTTARRSFPDLPVWRPLPVDIQPLRALMRGFAERNRGEDTDYVGALEPWFDRTDVRRPAQTIGAIEMLEKAPPHACQVLVWFTDGRLDFDFQGRQKSFFWDREEIILRSKPEGAAIVARATDMLCEPGGVVDRLREGVGPAGNAPFVAVVALDNPSAPLDFGLIAAIAEGRSESFGTCGSREAIGSFLKANQVADLIVGLRRAVLGAPDAGNSLITTCLADQIRVGQVLNCEFPFFISESLNSFNLLTTSAREGVDVSVVAPDGSVTRISERGVVTNGVGATLDISRPLPEIGLVNVTSGGSSRWAGEWKVRYSTDNPQLAREVLNRAEIYVFGGVEAALRPGPALVRGREGRFRVELRSVNGAPLSSSAFGEDSTLLVTVADEPFEVDARTISPDGSFEFLVTPPDDPNIAFLPVSVEVFPRVRITESTLVELTPWRGAIDPLVLKDPSRYPFVELLGDFAPLDVDNTESRATIRVDATAPESGGCIEFNGAQMDYPPALLEALGGVTGAPSFEVRDGGTLIDTASDCPVRVEDGQITDLEILLRLPPVALRIERGQVRGQVEFTSFSSREPSERETFRFEAAVPVEPKINVSVNRRTAILLMLVTILAPVVLMYLVSFLYSSRFRLPEGAMRVSVPVVLRNGRVYRGSPGRESNLRLADDDMSLSGLSGQWARSVDLAGFTFSIRPSMSPVGAPVASVRSSSGEFVISRYGARRGRGNPGSNLTNVWALAVPEVELAGAGFTPDGALREEGDTGPISGTLLALVPSGDSASTVFQDIVGDVERKAFGTLDTVVRVRAVAAEKTRLAEAESEVEHESETGQGSSIDLPGDSTPRGPISVLDPLPGDEDRPLAGTSIGSVDLGAGRKLLSRFRLRRSRADSHPMSTIVDPFDDDLPR